MNEYRVVQDLWGRNVVTDYRPVAGKSASTSGKIFEGVVHKKLKKTGVGVVTQNPSFNCHYGLERKGDFLININDTLIHLEAKQLGDCESHFDKISHCLMNLERGCYGKNFWLVIGYNTEGKRSVIRKIDALKRTCQKIKEEVSSDGISFELVDIRELENFITKYKDIQ